MALLNREEFLAQSHTYTQKVAIQALIRLPPEAARSYAGVKSEEEDAVGRAWEPEVSDSRH